MADRNLSALEGATIGVNVPALAGLVLRGDHERCVMLLEDVEETAKRLKLRAPGKAKAFTTKESENNFPSLADVRRWLGALTKKNKEGVATLRRLWLSLNKRVGE